MGLTIKKYKHGPTHWFINDHYYFFTGATYRKKRLLVNPVAKNIFIEKLFQYIEKYNWELLEWVVLDNHYHFLAKILNGSEIPGFINTLHKTSSFHIKQKLKLTENPFWYQYWDRCIRNEKHYYETATYILYNPVKHGYVDDLNNYPFSSFQLQKEAEDNELRALFRHYRPQDIDYYNSIDNF